MIQSKKDESIVFLKALGTALRDRDKIIYDAWQYGGMSYTQISMMTGLCKRTVARALVKERSRRTHESAKR